MCNAGLKKLDIKYDGTILSKELDIEMMKRYGIKYYSIYEKLYDVRIPGCKKLEALCRKIYKN